MSDCEFLEKCPIFARFSSEGTANYWINMFCKGKNEKCERKKLRLAGQEVPQTMLPNGTHLKNA